MERGSFRKFLGPGEYEDSRTGERSGGGENLGRSLKRRNTSLLLLQLITP